MKRNVTITLDEHTARWARVEAARRDTSVSDYVGSLLRERMQQDFAYEQAMAAWLSRKPVTLKRSGRYPGREAVHERGLR
jgi:hypothetical protein